MMDDSALKEWAQSHLNDRAARQIGSDGPHTTSMQRALPSYQKLAWLGNAAHVSKLKPKEKRALSAEAVSNQRFFKRFGIPKANSIEQAQRKRQFLRGKSHHEEVQKDEILRSQCDIAFKLDPNSAYLLGLFIAKTLAPSDQHDTKVDVKPIEHILLIHSLPALKADMYRQLVTRIARDLAPFDILTHSPYFIAKPGQRWVARLEFMSPTLVSLHHELKLEIEGPPPNSLHNHVDQGREDKWHPKIPIGGMIRGRNEATALKLRAAAEWKLRLEKTTLTPTALCIRTRQNFSYASADEIIGAEWTEWPLLGDSEESKLRQDQAFLNGDHLVPYIGRSFPEQVLEMQTKEENFRKSWGLDLPLAGGKEQELQVLSKDSYEEPLPDSGLKLYRPFVHDEGTAENTQRKYLVHSEFSNKPLDKASNSESLANSVPGGDVARVIISGENEEMLGKFSQDQKAPVSMSPDAKTDAEVKSAPSETEAAQEEASVSADKFSMAQDLESQEIFPSPPPGNEPMRLAHAAEEARLDKEFGHQDAEKEAEKHVAESFASKDKMYKKLEADREQIKAEMGLHVLPGSSAKSRLTGAKKWPEAQVPESLLPATSTSDSPESGQPMPTESSDAEDIESSPDTGLSKQTENKDERDDKLLDWIGSSEHHFKGENSLTNPEESKKDGWVMESSLRLKTKEKNIKQAQLTGKNNVVEEMESASEHTEKDESVVISSQNLKEKKKEKKKSEKTEAGQKLERNDVDGDSIALNENRVEGETEISILKDVRQENPAEVSSQIPKEEKRKKKKQKGKQKGREKSSETETAQPISPERALPAGPEGPSKVADMSPLTENESSQHLPPNPLWNISLKNTFSPSAKNSTKTAAASIKKLPFNPLSRISLDKLVLPGTGHPSTPESELTTNELPTQTPSELLETTLEQPNPISTGTLQNAPRTTCSANESAIQPSSVYPRSFIEKRHAASMEASRDEPDAIPNSDDALNFRNYLRQMSAQKSVSSSADYSAVKIKKPASTSANSLQWLQNFAERESLRTDDGLPKSPELAARSANAMKEAMRLLEMPINLPGYSGKKIERKILPSRPASDSANGRTPNTATVNGHSKMFQSPSRLTKSTESSMPVPLMEWDPVLRKCVLVKANLQGMSEKAIAEYRQAHDSIRATLERTGKLDSALESAKRTISFADEMTSSPQRTEFPSFLKSPRDEASEERLVDSQLRQLSVDKRRQQSTGGTIYPPPDSQVSNSQLVTWDGVEGKYVKSKAMFDGTVSTSSLLHQVIDRQIAKLNATLPNRPIGTKEIDDLKAKLEASEARVEELKKKLAPLCSPESDWSKQMSRDGYASHNQPDQELEAGIMRDVTVTAKYGEWRRLAFFHQTQPHKVSQEDVRKAWEDAVEVERRVSAEMEASASKTEPTSEEPGLPRKPFLALRVPAAFREDPESDPAWKKSSTGCLRSDQESREMVPSDPYEESLKKLPEKQESLSANPQLKANLNDPEQLAKLAHDFEQANLFRYTNRSPHLTEEQENLVRYTNRSPHLTAEQEKETVGPPPVSNPIISGATRNEAEERLNTYFASGFRTLNIGKPLEDPTKPSGVFVPKHQKHNAEAGNFVRNRNRKERTEKVEDEESEPRYQSKSRTARKKPQSIFQPKVLIDDPKWMPNDENLRALGLGSEDEVMKAGSRAKIHINKPRLSTSEKWALTFKKIDKFGKEFQKLQQERHRGVGRKGETQAVNAMDIKLLRQDLDLLPALKEFRAMRGGSGETEKVWKPHVQGGEEGAEEGIGYTDQRGQNGAAEKPQGLPRDTKEALEKLKSTISAEKGALMTGSKEEKKRLERAQNKIQKTKKKIQKLAKKVQKTEKKIERLDRKFARIADIKNQAAKVETVE
ncbi:hypothetical protein LZ554_008070 [Drepanopeziza brunnea f. sp. 'monogermtubi']|nr:hypothetical protein LZ554_008070 [Drepanopeziza brunnea f. sp. 'monogermtubi']